MSVDLVQSNRLSDKKNFGRIYTPSFLVNDILDLSGYVGDAVLRKRAIDNSCGDGAFLSAMVDRYCRAFPGGDLKNELETYICGIELDPTEYSQCIRRLDEVAASYGVRNVRWDILCADALTVDKFDGKMDFVLGNPPYVRVHNLQNTCERVKRFEFAREGMTDLYLVFYELGLKMLNERGTLGYIAPSSFFNSLAGRRFRESIVDERLLSKLYDLGHYKPFEASTYTAIVVLQKGRSQRAIEYGIYDGRPHFVEYLANDDFYINGVFFFAPKRRLAELKEILNCGDHDAIAVKNGFATLADSFFIADDFGDLKPFAIPVVKASTGKWRQCLFPYRDARIVSWEEWSKSEKLRYYFEQNRESLRARSLTENDAWYGFGRSQGIKDVYKDKIAVNALIRNVDDIKLTRAPAGTGVYSGLYILTELKFDTIERVICSQSFVDYVLLLNKYKSGGYCAFSSKDLKTYLEYQLQSK